MLLIPAIDLRGGRCVRLTQGRYDMETVYAEDPAAVAVSWERLGARRLHVVDLDGAREGRPVNLAALERIAAAVSIPVQVGGGLRTMADIAAAFGAGARWAILGTRALGDPAFLAEVLGRYPGRILVSLDVRGERVAVGGWLEESAAGVAEAARMLAAAGVREVIVTDVLRDGTLAGCNASLVAEVARLGLRVIAAGGVSTLEDVRRLRELEPEGVVGAVVGKALYAGTLDLAAALRVAEGREPDAGQADHPVS